MYSVVHLFILLFHKLRSPFHFENKHDNFRIALKMICTFIYHAFICSFIHLFMQPSDFVVRSSFEPLQRAWFSLQIVCVCGCVFANLGPFEYLASVDSHTDLWELTSLLSVSYTHLTLPTTILV